MDKLSGTQINKENRLTKLLQEKKEKLFSVFFTAGFPYPESTGDILTALEKHGADFVEIGIPYSDPLADGPVIQQTSHTALANGMSIEKLFGQLDELAGKVTIPMILMGYFNPVFQYGVEKFCKRAASAGVSGVILPDLPPDEYAEKYREIFGKYGLHFIFLVTPTTPHERIRRADSLSTAFIYAVGSSSITGVSKSSTSRTHFLKSLKKMNLSNIYIAGFGIKDRETLLQAWEYSAGAITGTAFMRKLMELKEPENAARELKNDLFG